TRPLSVTPRPLPRPPLFPYTTLFRSHAAGVGPDLRAAGEDTEVQGLEVGERVVRALDEEHRLPRCDLVAVVQRVDLELRPLHAAQLENRDRLVDAAEERVRFAEHLHGDARAMVVLERQL